MKHLARIGVFVLLAVLASKAAAGPPNVVIRTPSMARLAREGTKFTQAYACAVCSPTRVSLMTGLNAARHRVTNWTLRRGASNDGRHERLEFPPWNVNGMSPVAGVERTVHARALPDFLREAGYRTIHVGKAHFGAIGTPAESPIAIGFDVNVAGHAAGAPGSYYGTHDFSGRLRRGKPDGPRTWDVPGLEAYHGRDVNLTEALTIEAIREMEKAILADAPFFLYLAHYTVHAPIMPDRRFAGGYVGLDRREAAYASLIEAMDESLGDVLDALDANGVAENTVVLFMSDNGGLSAQARGGEPHTHNRPLSSGKGSVGQGQRAGGRHARADDRPLAGRDGAGFRLPDAGHHRGLLPDRAGDRRRHRRGTGRRRDRRGELRVATARRGRRGGCDARPPLALPE